MSTSQIFRIRERELARRKFVPQTPGKHFFARFALLTEDVFAFQANACVCARIYVVNQNNNTVTTYNADGTQTTPTTAGLNAPPYLAVDEVGKISVGNGGSDTVTTDNADGTQTMPTISNGLDRPVGIAVR